MAKQAGRNASVEVARISVKVSPDTSAFRRELYPKLKAIEDSLRPLIAFGADTRKIRPAVQRAIAGIPKGTVNIGADTAQMLAETRAAMAALPDGKVKIDADTNAARRQVAELADELDKVTSPRGVPKVGPNQRANDAIKQQRELTRLARYNQQLYAAQRAASDASAKQRQKNLEAELRALREKAEFDKSLHPDVLKNTWDHGGLIADTQRINREFALMKQRANDATAEVDRTLRPYAKLTRMEALRAKLWESHRRGVFNMNTEKVKFEPDPNLGAFANAKARMSAIFHKPIKQKVTVDVDRKQMAKAVQGANLLSKLTPSFGSGINPGGYAVIAAGILTVAAPLIGIISSALMAIPGIIAMIGAPIAAITLGLKGFGKAAEKIKPQFESLQTAMDDVAESRFTPVLQRVADELFPKLKEHLPGVTNALGDLADGVLDVFNREPTSEMFTNSIDRIAAALSGMKPGIDGFLSGFTGLVDQFTLKLPSITEWFNKAGQDFNNWVQKASADGTLSGAFDTLGQSIKIVLDLITDLGQKGIKLVSDPEAIAGFMHILDSIKNAINTIMDLSAKLNENWQGLVQTWRPVSIVMDLLQGDGRGAWGTMKDLWNNKPFIEGADGLKQSVDGIRNSVEGVGEAAAMANSNMADMFSKPSAADLPSNNPLVGNGAAAVLPSTATDLEAAKADISEYKSFIDDVTSQVRGSLAQATSGESLPAPNFTEFKAAWDALPAYVEKAGEGIKTAALAIPPALTGPVGDAMKAGGDQIGVQLGAGMEIGIGKGIPGVETAARNLAKAAVTAAQGELVIKSPSRVFTEIGEYTAEGFGKGMQNGYPAVLEQAKQMAARVAEAFAAGADPTLALSGLSKSEVNRVEKTLAYEIKRLEQQAKALDYQAKSTGNQGLKAQADAIRMRKDELSMQKDMVDLAGDYNDEMYGGGSGGDPLTEAISGLMSAPVDFAKATGQQFLQDLGVSGDGLISRALTEGIQYIFQIGSVDEALSIKDREQSKNLIASMGR